MTTHLKLCANSARATEESVSVDLTRDDDLSYWREQLGCSAEKLLAAVESVGPRVEEVAEYLHAGW